MNLRQVLNLPERNSSAENYAWWLNRVVGKVNTYVTFPAHTLQRFLSEKEFEYVALRYFPN